MFGSEDFRNFLHQTSSFSPVLRFKHIFFRVQRSVSWIFFRKKIHVLLFLCSMNQKDHNLVVCETRFNMLSFVLTELAESMRYGAKKIALPGVFPVFGTLPREK